MAIIIITSENFDNNVLKNPKPVLIDFWAEWCGPCRIIGPIVDGLSDEYADKLAVGKVNVDDEPAIAQKFSIRNIPTLLLFKNGQQVEKIVGAVSKQMLINKLQPHFS